MVFVLQVKTFGELVYRREKRNVEMAILTSEYLWMYSECILFDIQLLWSIKRASYVCEHRICCIMAYDNDNRDLLPIHC